MEKWLYREQANYHLAGTESTCIVQCAVGTRYVWVGNVATVSPSDYRAMRVSVHQPSYDKLERGQFSTKEDALEWVIALSEAELNAKPYDWGLAVIPSHVR
jgi:hypothetical protein